MKDLNYKLRLNLLSRLEGEAFISEGENIIELNMNPKKQKLMDSLNKDLCVLNNMDVYNLDLYVIKFNIIC